MARQRNLLFLKAVLKTSVGLNGSNNNGDPQMPIYEYKCSACGERFEKLVWISSKAEIICPKCGSAQTERQLSTFATKGSNCTPSGTGFS